MANHNPLDPLHAHRQIPAIKYGLATARDYIQDDLKAKFNHGENIFFYNDLLEYRMNNSCEDIAEDLDVKSRHGIKKNETAGGSVSMAFRGYNGKDFPEHKFGGLFGKVTNDYIQRIRNKKNGLETADMINPETGVRYVVEGGRIGGPESYEQGIGIHAQTPEEKAENALIGGRIGGRATIETHGYQIGNGGRASAEATGKHVWSLEEIVDIDNFREESFNHSSKFNPNSPNWNYTTSKMNEKHNEDWTTGQVKDAYRNKKHLLPDEEE